MRRPGDAPVAVHHLEDQFEQKEEMSLAADDTGSRWKIIEQLLLGWLGRLLEPMTFLEATRSRRMPGRTIFSNFGSQKQVEAEARDG